MLHIAGALFRPRRAAEQNRPALHDHDLGADWRYLKSAEETPHGKCVAF
jgi:hypothetical protein